MSVVNLFDGIILEAVSVHGNIFPSIMIVPLRRPSDIFIGDHFVLEKYEIDSANLDHVEAAREATLCQKILYYMTNHGANGVYMSAYNYMGGVGLPVPPTWIDVETYFETGTDKIIDTDTSPEDNVYMYRLTTFHNNIEEASEYLLGLSMVIFSTDWESVMDLLTDDMIGMRTTHGTGSLYRETREGTIMMKGYPMTSATPRFRGPIESSKTNCNAFAKDNSLSAIGTKLDTAEEFISNSLENLETIGYNLSTWTRGHND